MVVPLDRGASFDETRELAGAIAGLAAARDPEGLTTEQRKDRRHGRLFLDWLRNAYGQTTASPYSVRPLPGAPVATPIEWGELGDVEAQSYDIYSIPRRLAQKGDPWAAIGRHAQAVGPARERLARLSR